MSAFAEVRSHPLEHGQPIKGHIWRGEALPPSETINYQYLLGYNLINLSHTHAGILTVWILCRSYADKYNWYKFLLTTAMPCQEDNIAKNSFPSSSSYMPSNPSSMILPELNAGWGDINVPLNCHLFPALWPFTRLQCLLSTAGSFSGQD